MPSGSERVNVLEMEQTIHFVAFGPTNCTLKTNILHPTNRLSTIEHYYVTYLV